jgi:hypothetical protein
MIVDTLVIVASELAHDPLLKTITERMVRAPLPKWRLALSRHFRLIVVEMQKTLTRHAYLF